MPAEPLVHLVEDPEDSLGLAQRVSALGNRLDGRAVCRATPGGGSSVQLAAELLVALGKRFDALRFERVRPRGWDLVDIWAEAERVRHLFVLRAHLLGPRAWRELMAFGARRGIEVWLVVASAGCHRRGLAGMEPRLWNPATFAARWPRPDPGDNPENRGETSFPDVPAEDFPTFRAACRRLLDNEHFERVDEVYCAAMDEAAPWLEPWRARCRVPAPPDLSLGEVAAQLQRLLVGSCGPADAVVRVRAAQAAYFRTGWLIGFEPVVVGADSGLVTLGRGLDTAVASRLRRFCVPRSTAAMALFLAADLRSEALCRLDVGHVGVEAATVDLGDWQIAVPDFARSLLRALVVERRWAGAGDGEPLFVHPRTGGRYVGSALRNVLRSVGAKAGISVGVQDSLGSPSGPGAWLSARGLRITRLASVPATLG